MGDYDSVIYSDEYVQELTNKLNQEIERLKSEIMTQKIQFSETIIMLSKLLQEKNK